MPIYRTFVVVASLLTIITWSNRVRAEDLNQLYGPSWTCNDITPAAPDDPLTAEYNACITCNFTRQDFFRDPPGSNPAGHCIPKPNVVTAPQPGTQPSGSGSSAPPFQQTVYWHGFAFDSRKLTNGVFAAIGYSGRVDSRKAAEDVALLMCRNAGGQNCGSYVPQNSYSHKQCYYAVACTNRASDGKQVDVSVGISPGDNQSQLAAACRSFVVKACRDGTKGALNCDSGEFTPSRIVGGCLQVDTVADGVSLTANTQ
jgi:hypothetical protein